MAVGKSKAKIVTTLNNQIQVLIEQNRAAALSAYNGVGRIWMLGPYAVNGVSNNKPYWTGNTDDLVGMSLAFDKSEVVSTFNSIMDVNDPGTASDKIAMRFQNDYLAAMERAFRTRHAGSVRSEMFSAARRGFLADGNLQDFSTDQAQRIISRGQ
jgi:hypothetical protein